MEHRGGRAYTTHKKSNETRGGGHSVYNIQKVRYYNSLMEHRGGGGTAYATACLTIDTGREGLATDHVRP